MDEDVTALADPAAVMAMVGGLWASKTLVAAVDVDLFGISRAAGGVTARELAERSGIEVRPAQMLLTACAALGLLTVAQDKYHNTPTADDYLVSGEPYSLVPFIEMIDKVNYPGWMVLGEAVRRNEPTAIDPFVAGAATGLPYDISLFWEGMHAVSRNTARVLRSTVDLTVAHRLLDVGGGGAGYDVELCRRLPDLQLAIFDLPHVCDITAPILAAAGVADGVALIPGDFFAEELPTGYDTMLLSMILHDWPEEVNQELLRKCFRALEPGGRLLICELVVNDERDGPLDAALMNLVMLVQNYGSNHTDGEYKRWLRQAGFVEVTTTPMAAAGANAVISAVKPRS